MEVQSLPREESQHTGWDRDPSPATVFTSEIHCAIPWSLVDFCTQFVTQNMKKIESDCNSFLLVLNKSPEQCNHSVSFFEGFTRYCRCLGYSLSVRVLVTGLQLGWGLLISWRVSGCSKDLGWGYSLETQLLVWVKLPLFHASHNLLRRPEGFVSHVLTERKAKVPSCRPDLANALHASLGFCDTWCHPVGHSKWHGSDVGDQRSIRHP